MFSYCSTWHSKSSWQLTGLLRGDTWTMGVGLCVIASRKCSNRARAWTSCVSISLQVRCPCPTLSISLHAFRGAGKKWTDREVGRWASVSFVESSWPRTVFLCPDVSSSLWCRLSFVTIQLRCWSLKCTLIDRGRADLGSNEEKIRRSDRVGKEILNWISFCLQMAQVPMLRLVVIW